MSAPHIGTLQAGPAGFSEPNSPGASTHSPQPDEWVLHPDLAEAWHKQLKQGVSDPRIQSLCASSFRMGQLSCAAVEYSAGYTAGWRWGVACGVVGAMLISAAVLLSSLAGYVS